MSKARDLINAHLYPLLAAFAVVYGAIQIAPLAQQARDFNQCRAFLTEYRLSFVDEAIAEDKQLAVAYAVSQCHGSDHSFP